MRIRSFQTFIQSQKAAQCSQLEQLRGKRLGLDAIYWLRTLPNLKDPFADAVGGLPLSVYTVLDRSLANFAKYQISLLFVFEGIQPRSGMSFFAQLHHQIDDAWALVSKGDITTAQYKFAQATSRINTDFIFTVSRYIQSKKYDVIQAPYFAASQLAYFAQIGAIDAVFGPPAALIYGIPRVILSMSFYDARFEWVGLAELLTSWGINEEEFIDACLFAGTDYCLSIPYIASLQSQQLPGHRAPFGAAIDLVKQGPLTAHLQQYLHDEVFSDHEGYCVSKTLIKYPLVLYLEGRLRPLVRKPPSADDSVLKTMKDKICVPDDFHKVMGHPLPSILYILMARQILSRKLPSVLAQGEWSDTFTPIVDTLEYRDLLKEVREYRCRAVGLIAARLNESFRKKAIKFHRNVSHKSVFPASDAVQYPQCRPGLPWSFTEDRLKAELKRQNVEKPSFHFCLNWHAHETENGGTLLAEIPPNCPDPPTGPVTDLTNFLVFQTTVYFMILENAGFFSQEGGATEFGLALAGTAIEFEENTLITLELMKRGVLMSDPLEAPADRPFPEVNWLKNPANSPYLNSILLIARVTSLVPMTMRDQELWLAPINFDLAAFHTLIKLVKRTLRYLVEACITNLILQDVNLLKIIPVHAFSPKNPLFPVFQLPRNCLGIMFVHFLEFETDPATLQRFMNESYEVRNHLALQRLGRLEVDLQKTFLCCKHPVVDLIKAIRFWLELRKLVDWLSRNIESRSFKMEIENAHQYLKLRLYQTGLSQHVLFQHKALSTLRAEIEAMAMEIKPEATE